METVINYLVEMTKGINKVKLDLEKVEIRLNNLEEALRQTLKMGNIEE